MGLVGDQDEGGGHGTKVGANVNGIGEKEEKDDGVKDGAGVVMFDDGGKTGAGNQADATADFLDGGGKRGKVEGEKELAQAKEGASLRIGGDAGGVIVRSAGDESGTKEMKKGADFSGQILHGFFDGLVYD